jgi:sterol desaturase/sphingolipid hydroxylase (fatty acid hydroxylase superfamily)
MKDFENISKFIFISEMVSYAIIIFFIYLFYKNYKTINATDSVKQLMNTIIKTRKTVTIYIRVFIIYNVLASLIIFYFAVKSESLWQANYNTAIANGNQTAFLIGLIIVLLIFLIVFVIFLWLFYRLIYGILLKRLYKNHQELKKIDL